MKAFLRFQGLSLLWSWMVDGGGKKARLQSQVGIGIKLKTIFLYLLSEGNFG